MVTPNPSLVSLIARARDPNRDASERHAAFAEIVRHFQDFAIACARARLHDPALAEDAAQDAFLVAWERLDQLRDPAAFGGWIRRLIVTQCHRRLRRAPVLLVPGEAAGDVVARDPATDASAAHNSMRVQAALAELSPGDRLVLVLFYGSDRSHAEIADWLRVPVTTVARRIAHAKRRLRRHLQDALAGELRRQSRVAAERFEPELSARLCRVTGGDGTVVASLLAEAPPSGLPAVAGAPACAYLIEDRSGRAVAYAAARQSIFKPIYELQIAIGAAGLSVHAGDVLLMQIVEDLVARDAVALHSRVPSSRAPLIEFLGARGFELIRRDEEWHRSQAVARPHSHPLRRLQDLLESSSLFDSALQLWTDICAADSDWQSCLPIHPETLRRVVRRVRFGAVAMVDGAVEGFIAASPDPHRQGICRIDLVMVSARRRRQGIGRALLAEMCEQSRTPSLSVLAPPSCSAWLARCGFQPRGGSIVFERLLRKTVQVDAGRLSEYVGRYIPEHPVLEPITIERYRDTLISKTRDMRDVLLASSESEFFTRHHYGHGRFECDARGRVDRLVYMEGPHTVVAVRQGSPAAVQ